MKLLMLATLASLSIAPAPIDGADLSQIITIGHTDPSNELTVIPLPVSEFLISDTPEGMPPIVTYNYSIAYTIEHVGAPDTSLLIRRKDSDLPGTVGPAFSEGVSGFGLPATVQADDYVPLELAFLSPDEGLVMSWGLAPPE